MKNKKLIVIIGLVIAIIAGSVAGLLIGLTTGNEQSSLADSSSVINPDDIIWVDSTAPNPEPDPEVSSPMVSYPEKPAQAPVIDSNIQRFHDRLKVCVIVEVPTLRHGIDQCHVRVVAHLLEQFLRYDPEDQPVQESQSLGSDPTTEVMYLPIEFIGGSHLIPGEEVHVVHSHDAQRIHHADVHLGQSHDGVPLQPTEEYYPLVLGILISHGIAGHTRHLR